MLAAAAVAARRVELDRRQVPAGLPEAEADPDRAVAVRAADLERAFRVAGGDEHAKKASVFFRDGELARVGGLDRRKQPERCRAAPAIAPRGAPTSAATSTAQHEPRRRSACSIEPFGYLPGRRARVGDAIGNADAAQSAAGHEQSGRAASARGRWPRRERDVRPRAGRWRVRTDRRASAADRR